MCSGVPTVLSKENLEQCISTYIHVLCQTIKCITCTIDLILLFKPNHEWKRDNKRLNTTLVHPNVFLQYPCGNYNFAYITIESNIIVRQTFRASNKNIRVTSIL